MVVKVNGKVQTFDSNQIDLIALLQHNKVTKPEMVSVQLNGSFVKRDTYNTTYVKANDEVDFIYFMGGGNFSYIEI